MAVGLGILLSFLFSQFKTLPYPAKSYTGQTIIVTGSNVGLGLEAARHFVRLGAQKVIIAVRSIRKGEEAAKSIHKTTGRVGIAEVWELDLGSYASVDAFAKRASGLERLDIVVNNAGILTHDFKMAEDNESTITVNVVSAALLSLLLLPKLRETSVRLHKEVVLTFTGSFDHFITEFPEQKNEHILKALAVQGNADMANRYFTSKLMQLLVARELADQLTNSSKPGEITVSVVSPGFVKTSIIRKSGIMFKIFFLPWRAIMARSTEVGSRTILHGAAGGRETHGQYLDCCAVASPSDFVSSGEGHRVQKKLWREVTEVLERVNPGVVNNI